MELPIRRLPVVRYDDENEGRVDFQAKAQLVARFGALERLQFAPTNPSTHMPWPILSCREPYKQRDSANTMNKGRTHHCLSKLRKR